MLEWWRALSYRSAATCGIEGIDLMSQVRLDLRDDDRVPRKRNETAPRLTSDERALGLAKRSCEVMRDQRERDHGQDC